MEITLYKNTDPKNKITKTLENGLTLAGNFRGVCNLSTPVLDVATDNAYLYNYCYIPALQRYYFINDITIVRSGVFSLHCHIDVLKTYENEIKQTTAEIVKSENPTKNIKCELTESVETTEIPLNDVFNHNGVLALATATGYES